MPNCLLCGSGVWYVGLFNADCTNTRCTNYRQPPPPTQAVESEYGSWNWAVTAQKEGWRIEFTRPRSGSWHELTAQLGPTNPGIGEYEFRINQECYSPKSQYKRGSKEWRDEMIRRGCKVRAGRDEYEVIP
jgi:hypothetical protein